jgi:hypothetical protein
MKCMEKAKIKGSSLDNLKGEVKIGELLGSHPHIVHMKEFVENSDRWPFTVMSHFQCHFHVRFSLLATPLSYTVPSAQILHHPRASQRRCESLGEVEVGGWER